MQRRRHFKHKSIIYNCRRKDFIYFKITLRHCAAARDNFLSQRRKERNGKNTIMIKRLLLFSLFLFSSTTFAQNKKIAVTIDDLPLQRIGRFGNAKSAEILNRLISSIKKQNAPVIGFVNEDKLETTGKVDPQKVALLENWLNAGFDLGNHTYSHKSANVIPVKAFEEEILKGERIIRKLIEANGKSLKYFRHPFLQTGRSVEIKNEIEAFLKEHNYQVAPVTIDNSEWIFGSAYDKAIDSNKTEAAKRIGGEYIE